MEKLLLLYMKVCLSTLHSTTDTSQVKIFNVSNIQISISEHSGSIYIQTYNMYTD